MQNLPTMVGNKFTAYLLYAIGEIVLVVIGILIAVSLNNWNSEIKASAESKDLSGRMLSETLQNQVLLDRKISELNEDMQAMLEFLRMTGIDYQSQDARKTDSLMYHIISSPQFEMNASVLNEAISTGKLALIQSDSLRNLIYELPAVFSDIQSSIKYIDDQDNFYLYGLMYDLVALRKIDGAFSPYADKLKTSNFPKFDNRQVLGNVRFESIVDNKYFLVSRLRNTYLETQRKLDRLEILLKQEINE